MPGCAAVGCSNSSVKGFLMKRFPRNPNRRKEWAVRTKRYNWFPTDSSVLCEAHFEPEMWEITREDGTKRLKVNAVPTIFSFTKMTPKKFFDRSVPSTCKIIDTELSIIEHSVKSEVFVTSIENIKCEFATGNTDETEQCMSLKIIKNEHSYAKINQQL
ncbi:THAP domain-containing protein 2 [Anoplophora glabripennis]|uniref:THAP domain-containing protein 2 n=1 Tax=Anoplophora glabripennis TaxID=217634 RepID=UPI0008738F62|nr:THAP domain-containing protein 2 [Anoplophora glabripennis]